MPPLSPLCRGLQGAGPAQHGTRTPIWFQVVAQTLDVVGPWIQPWPSRSAWVRHQWQCRLSGQSVWPLVAVAHPSPRLSPPHINTVSGGSPDHNHRHPSDWGRYHCGLRSQFKFLLLTCSHCHGVSRATSLPEHGFTFSFSATCPPCILSFPSLHHISVCCCGAPHPGSWCHATRSCCPLSSSDTSMPSLTLYPHNFMFFFFSPLLNSFIRNSWDHSPKETMFSSICFCSKKKLI